MTETVLELVFALPLGNLNIHLLKWTYERTIQSEQILLTQ